MYGTKSRVNDTPIKRCDFASPLVHRYVWVPLYMGIPGSSNGRLYKLTFSYVYIRKEIWEIIQLYKQEREKKIIIIIIIIKHNNHNVTIITLTSTIKTIFICRGEGNMTNLSHLQTLRFNFCFPVTIVSLKWFVRSTYTFMYVRLLELKSSVEDKVNKVYYNYSLW